MEIEEKRVYCKRCARVCVKKTSRSKENPGRRYYTCPIRWEDGGHGWMEWVESDVEYRARALDILREYKERVDVLERNSSRSSREIEAAGVKIAEINKHLSNVEALAEDLQDLAEKLRAEKERSRCLMKCLKGCVVLICCLFAMYLVGSRNVDSNLYLAPNES